MSLAATPVQACRRARGGVKGGLSHCATGPVGDHRCDRQIPPRCRAFIAEAPRFWGCRVLPKIGDPEVSGPLMMVSQWQTPAHAGVRASMSWQPASG